MKDHTYLQRHVGSAIAYNVWQYFEVTADLEFLQFYGAELILEIGPRRGADSHRLPRRAP
jgi:trehalose/maltose hydrolase-like predicted phosphorylase